MNNSYSARGSGCIEDDRSGDDSQITNQISIHGSGGVHNPGKASNTKVSDPNCRRLVYLLPIVGLIFGTASVGIGMNAGHKADSPTVWGPLIFSIACIGSLVALCNAKASNSNEPNNSKPAASPLPIAPGSYKGIGPYGRA